MEVSQMLTQAMYSNDYVLKQLPHCTSDILERCKAKGLNSVWDLMDLEDDERNEVLQMEPAKLADVARFCNSYPAVEVNFKCERSEVSIGERVTVNIVVERENDEDGLAPAVVAPLYPDAAKRKDEAWWVVLGDKESNELLAIKRVTVNTTQKFALDFTPTKAGRHEYKLYAICDSYVGVDQEFDIPVKVEEGSRQRKRRHEGEEDN
uniref:SEC63 domain-containing protein n=1 Tax=Steinernema glaseri TaxID=37863 RepID=A0A1I7YF31_9BILA